MLKRQVFVFLLAALTGAFLPLPRAFAGSITMETSRQWEVAGGRVDVRVRVTNKGDEAAQDVQMEVRFREAGETTTVLRSLLPQESTAFALSLPIGDKTGSFPLISRLRYKDIHGYPFTALSCDVVPLEKALMARVLGRADAVTLTREAILKATVKNSHDFPVELLAELVLPDELSCTGTRKQLRLDPGTEKDVEFPIRNFSALMGSTYWVPILLLYEETGVHYCSFAPLEIHIGEKVGTSLFGHYWVAIALVLCWTGVIILLQFRKKRHS